MTQSSSSKTAITTNQQLSSSSSYPAISFKKCILLNHQSTIKQLTINTQPQLLSNPTIKRCVDMHFRDQKHKIFYFLTISLLMKITSKIIHMNRSLALSAPRNWKSVLFKYVLVPYLGSVYLYTKDMKRTILDIKNQVEQDLEADRLWQPIFQRKYPNWNQPLQGSLLKKFSIEDVAKGNMIRSSESLV